MNRFSSPEHKIALFRSLFCGREDVYAQRFVSRRDGRAGYSPACANEWVRDLCRKPTIRCADCLHQSWKPVTDEVIRWHLEGKDAAGAPFVMGSYAMMADETCKFLAVDFDGGCWLEEASVFCEVCEEKKLPVALERSRSGAGGHVWLFFSTPVSAAMARQMGAFLITSAMERCKKTRFRTYDRMFPNQDTMPRGGFGNLIALPLQNEARARGNSVFINLQGEPHPDQWEALSHLEKIEPTHLEEIIAVASRKNRLLPVPRLSLDEDAPLPWELPASRRLPQPELPASQPKQIEAVLADALYLPNESLTPQLRARLLRLASFQNPEFYRAQAMRLSTHDKPRIICCAEESETHLALPRGCLGEVAAHLKQAGIAFSRQDLRRTGPALELTFRGTLRPEQEKAAGALIAHDTGVLAATTAFGKTVLAAWLVARRGVATLVVVHRQQLLRQWVSRLSEFLGIPEKEIGVLGGGKNCLTGNLDVALVQSLVRSREVRDEVANYAHVIFDECHHLPAAGFELVARRVKARFITGLSATVVRKDGHHPILYFQCGPIRHRVAAKDQARQRPFTHQVIICPTNLNFPPNLPEEPRQLFQALCHYLVCDPARNERICGDVAEAIQDGRNPLVLTERAEHLGLLLPGLRQTGAKVIVLRGGLGHKNLRETLDEVEAVSESTPRILLATGKFIGEGFDDSRLDTLFLVMPVSWKGTIAQYVGRLHRLHTGKREVRVYDYADLNHPMLARMLSRRCDAYENAGYTILSPGNALPGWPADVPLPAETSWKQEHMSTVTRLAADGLDATLARKFLEAARPVHEGDARSRAEAFFFARLETLPATSGCFELNARLPIPFDGHGEMEVDFYCREKRLAIELDGGQHLGDEDAYRRDRRKDYLLQKHNILVIRFLVSDLPKELPRILDTVTESMRGR